MSSLQHKDKFDHNNNKIKIMLDISNQCKDMNNKKAILLLSIIHLSSNHYLPLNKFQKQISEDAITNSMLKLFQLHTYPE